MVTEVFLIPMVTELMVMVMIIHITWILIMAMEDTMVTIMEVIIPDIMVLEVAFIIIMADLAPITHSMVIQVHT